TSEKPVYASACYTISYMVWRKMESVRIDPPPNALCTIYQDESCELAVTHGSDVIPVPRRANTIRCEVLK
ncbi:hypothetical protein BG015_002588, partial [Linnemannia schmuckeri]